MARRSLVLAGSLECALSSAFGLALATSLIGSAALGAEGIAGTYCLRGVMEVGSCLRLSADNQFEYFLAYGAYDEHSKGRWSAEGEEVVLDSPPYDKAPSFVFKEFQRAKGDGFDVVVVGEDGQPISGIDVRVTCDGHAVSAGMTGTSNYAVPCKEAPQEIMLGIRMMGVAEQSIKVAPPAGADKAYVIAFDPGDLGRKQFQATRLRRDGPDALVMTYANPAIEELNGRAFKYVREEAQ